MNACCEETIILQPLQHRIASNGYDLEVSKDGGETWQADPSDPRLALSPTAAPPALSGDSQSKCDTAQSIVNGLQDISGKWRALISAGLQGLALALVLVAEAIAVVFLPEAAAPLLIAFVYAITTGFAGLTLEQWDERFDDTFWQDVLCAFFCALNDDGTIDARGLSIAKREIFKLHGAGQLSAAEILFAMINTIGGVLGIAVLARFGAAANADCSGCECECSDDFNFTNNPDWTYLEGLQGTWVAGQGFRNTYYQANLGYVASVTIPVKKCSQVYVKVEWNNIPLQSHSTENYTYKNRITGEIVTTTGFNNVACGTGDCVDVRQSPAGDFELLSINFEVDSQTKSNCGIKRIRYNTENSFP